MGGIRCLPLTIFECAGVAGYQRLPRDRLAYCDLAIDRQRHSYDTVREHHALTIIKSQHDVAREHHALTVSHVDRLNPALSNTLRQVPIRR